MNCYPIKIMNIENQLIKEGNELRCALQNMRANRDKWRSLFIGSILAVVVLTIISIFG